MTLLALALSFLALAGAAQEPATSPTQSSTTQTTAAHGPAAALPDAPVPSGDTSALAPGRTASTRAIVVPEGTKVALALTGPVWAKTVKAGDRLYSTTMFPIALQNRMAIPPGTYVEGQIDSINKPGWFSPHAEFRMHFTKMIFANGYTVELPIAPIEPGGIAGPPRVMQGAAVADVYVDVSARSDILLDNGAQIEMILQAPLSVDAESVADAAAHARPPIFTAYKSATQCRPTPGSPGTPDTVIPGTPPTPPTVIPGGPGMPDTVIPGSPGTPDTVIPGSPGTAGISCPDPPVVVSKPPGRSSPVDAHKTYSESFTVVTVLQVAGKTLAPGQYQITWAGGPITDVQILQNGKKITKARARIVTLEQKPEHDELRTRASGKGAPALDVLQFASESIVVIFTE